MGERGGGQGGELGEGKARGQRGELGDGKDSGRGGRGRIRGGEGQREN